MLLLVGNTRAQDLQLAALSPPPAARPAGSPGAARPGPAAAGEPRAPAPETAHARTPPAAPRYQIQAWGGGGTERLRPPHAEVLIPLPVAVPSATGAELPDPAALHPEPLREPFDRSWDLPDRSLLTRSIHARARVDFSSATSLSLRLGFGDRAEEAFTFGIYAHTRF